MKGLEGYIDTLTDREKESKEEVKLLWHFGIKCEKGSHLKGILKYWGQGLGWR